MEDMREKYTIRIDRLIARIDLHQAPTLQDITESLRAILDSPHYHPDLRLLVVDHGTDFSMTEPQMNEVVQAVAPLVRRFKSSAFAVSTDNHYAFARQFNSCFFKAGIVSGAFRDEVAAGVWLLSTGDK